MCDLVAEEALADGGHLDREFPAEARTLGGRERLGALTQREVGAKEPFTDVELVGKLDLSLNIHNRSV